jgi:hypothetical protein
MAVRDESNEARLVRMYRQMSPAQRSEIAAQMFEDALALVRASIRQSHPHFSHAELETEVRRRMLPRGLPEEVYQWRPRDAVTD